MAVHLSGCTAGATDELRRRDRTRRDDHGTRGRTTWKLSTTGIAPCICPVYACSDPTSVEPMIVGPERAGRQAGPHLEL